MSRNTLSRISHARLVYSTAKLLLANVPTILLPHISKGHALAGCKQAKKELINAIREVETLLGREHRV